MHQFIITPELAELMSIDTKGCKSVLSMMNDDIEVDVFQTIPSVHAYSDGQDLKYGVNAPQHLYSGGKVRLYSIDHYHLNPGEARWDERTFVITKDIYDKRQELPRSSWKSLVRHYDRSENLVLNTDIITEYQCDEVAYMMDHINETRFLRAINDFTLLVRESEIVKPDLGEVCWRISQLLQPTKKHLNKKEFYQDYGFGNEKIEVRNGRYAFKIVGEATWEQLLLQ